MAGEMGPYVPRLTKVTGDENPVTKPRNPLGKGIELAHAAWVLQHLVSSKEGTFVRKTDSDKGKITAMIAIAKLPDSDTKRKAYIYSALNITDGTDPSSDQEKAAAAIYADALDLCVKPSLQAKYENNMRTWTWAGGLGDY
eukprot:CAMPEP_0182863744 /NCGR_PEP_ID=MMETSP0034_2-20130328/6811_1 /TAXON_ID=156128 /ORGANISM="Nephroselmis pyriformis, Strain CCMP717" /LENGTH=140 /DNA_ID=CAMNT_0024995983 /DNA_START=2167 /DNA_END=2590 /DNA_ORIENTATION=-